MDEARKKGRRDRPCASSGTVRRAVRRRREQDGIRGTWAGLAQVGYTTATRKEMKVLEDMGQVAGIFKKIWEGYVAPKGIPGSWKESVLPRTPRMRSLGATKNAARIRLSGRACSVGGICSDGGCRRDRIPGSPGSRVFPASGCWPGRRLRACG